MSRRRVPRRFRAALWAALWVVLAGLAAGWASPADAQRIGAGQGGMRTVVGGYHDARTCEQAAIAGRPDEAAVAACDRSLRSDPLTRRERATLLLNRGLLRMRRQEARAALEDFDAALSIRRDFAEAHVNRAAALAGMGEYGAAVAALTTALSYGVREPHVAYFNRGAAREALGDLRGALEDYSTALELRPGWPPAEEEVARFHHARHGRLAQMIPEARAEETLTPAAQ